MYLFKFGFSIFRVRTMFQVFYLLGLVVGVKAGIYILE